MASKESGYTWLPLSSNEVSEVLENIYEQRNSRPLPKPGDILLNDERHTCVVIGTHEARSRVWLYNDSEDVEHTIEWSQDSLEYRYPAMGPEMPLKTLLNLIEEDPRAGFEYPVPCFYLPFAGKFVATTKVMMCTLDEVWNIYFAPDALGLDRMVAGSLFPEDFIVCPASIRSDLVKKPKTKKRK